MQLNQDKIADSSQIVSFSKQFALRHVFRAGAIVWCKYKGKDYYVVFKSITRPNRGTQLPGGRIERNENFAETIIREVREETGLECRIICPLGLVYFENPADNYSNMQFYYIVRPVYPLDVFKKWKYTDKDVTKQELEVWCVPTDKDPSYLAAGQDQVVNMFTKWLQEHKKTDSPKHGGRNSKGQEAAVEVEVEE
jgi:8-oxo-dGTP pyrophosphatase MutT (NUDIX family)